MDGKPVAQKLLRAASHNEARYETVHALRGIRVDGGVIKTLVE